MIPLDDVAPAVAGLQGFVGWFSGVMGTLQSHIALVLGAAGLGAGASVVAWVLTGALVVGTAWKFKALVFYGFLGVVVFAVVTGLGVRLWG